MTTIADNLQPSAPGWNRRAELPGATRRRSRCSRYQNLRRRRGAPGALGGGPDRLRRKPSRKRWNKMVAVADLPPTWHLHRTDPEQQDAPGGRTFRLGAHGGPPEDRRAPVGAAPGAMRAAAGLPAGQHRWRPEQIGRGAPGQALALAREVAQLPGLTLRGLMTIPEPAPDFAPRWRCIGSACAVR